MLLASISMRDKGKLFHKIYGRRRFSYSDVIGMNDVTHMSPSTDGKIFTGVIGTDKYGFRIGATMQRLV